MANNVSQSNASYGTTDADAGAEISKVANEYNPGLGPVANALRQH
jgi:hypothetical protein